MAKKKVAAEDVSVDRVAERAKILQDRLKALGLSPTVLKKDMGEAEAISTGIVEINEILGTLRGIPKGTLLQIVGESQGGKSYIAMKMAAEVHALGGRVAWLNVENSFFPPRARELGVAVDDLDRFELYENLGKAEHWGRLCLKLVQSREYDLVVIDSITALNPEQEYDRDLDDDAVVGTHARFIQRLTRRLMSDCAETNTIGVLINQFRMHNIAMGQGQNKMVRGGTGGRSLDFFCHIIFEVDRLYSAEAKMMDADGQVIGGKSKIYLAKTRYSQPHKSAQFPIFFLQAENDPVSDMLYCASRANSPANQPYIKQSGRNPNKKWVYADYITGEVLVSEPDRMEFLRKLREADPPSKLARGDTSTNAFEYLCGRVKVTGKKLDGVLAAMEAPPAAPVNEGASEDTDDLDEMLGELSPEEEEALQEDEV